MRTWKAAAGLWLALWLVAPAAGAGAGCGWYLLVPPELDEKLKPRASPGRWDQWGAFENANACETERRRYQDKILAQWQRDPESASVFRMVNIVSEARCIASDDPRLSPPAAAPR